MVKIPQLTCPINSGDIWGEFLEMSQRFCSELIEDSGQQFGDLFVLAVTGDCERVGRQRSLDLGVVEVDDWSIVLDHVHLLDAGDVVYLEYKNLVLIGWFYQEN